VEPQQNYDGSHDNNTMVVSFPCSYPSGTALAAHVTAIEQLEHVRRLQREWSDNAVSCTVYYRPEELPRIQDWLSRNFSTGCKSLSFLLHSEHGFAQAPYEEISEAEFKSLRAATTPITGVSFAEGDVTDELGECEGGHCPIK
jgi:ribonucleoside-triphosphate reductase (thioredoxin)